MKSGRLTCIIAMTFLAVAIPLSVAAQENNAKQPHYTVKDMGTFGGPNSWFFSAPVVDSVNNRGTVVGGADTGLQDPYAPNCFSPDCYILHAFKWKNGFLADLGTLPGGYNSTAYWINERGLIVGGSENGFIDPITGFPEQIAVLWQRDGEIIDLGTLGGNFSFGNAMNNRGEVVGIAQNTVPDPYSFIGVGTETHGFIWRNGYMEDLGTLGGPDSWGAEVNERSQVVGWSYVDSTPNANNGDFCMPNVPTQDPFLREKDGRMLDLGTFGGTCGVVGSFEGGSGGAINKRGQIIGTSNLAGNQTHHAFLWEGSLTDLGTLGGGNSEAYWINDAGEVVGQADLPGSQQNHHGFLWRKGMMTDLGVPHGQPCSTAIDINAKGQVILGTGACDGSGGPGSLWQDGVLYDLNMLIPRNSGFFIGDVNFINDDGEIAATGILPNGDQHDLLLIPVGNGNDSANRGAVETEVAPARIDRSPRALSRYSQFGRRTSATK
jgi:probable HAF family extracellular repeat protein